MARYNSHHNRPSRREARPPIVVNTKPEARPVAVPKNYGKPFVILEDVRLQTFIFEGGAWIAYSRSIAQCRSDQCQVKQLAQKVNNMTRYEVSLLL